LAVGVGGQLGDEGKSLCPCLE